MEIGIRLNSASESVVAVMAAAVLLNSSPMVIEKVSPAPT